MADKVVTPANVLLSSTSTAVKNTGTAGAAITAGQVVYKNPTTGLFFPMQATTTVSGVLATPAGIALNNAATGQPFSYVNQDLSGTFNPGYATSAGEITLVSGTAAGNVTVFGNLTSGQSQQPVIVYLGTGTASAILNITPAAVTF
jgi:hypothetical protein